MTTRILKNIDLVAAEAAFKDKIGVSDDQAENIFIDTSFSNSTFFEALSYKLQAYRPAVHKKLLANRPLLN